MHVAILIAVEEYADKRFAPRAFAAADVKALGLALQGVGFAELDQVVLIDAQATKTTVESKFRRTLRSLSPDDTLLIYIAAHGFADRGRSYLVCHDTQAADLLATSIAWSALLAQLRDSECQRVTLFLDSCATGLGAANEHDGLAYEELRDFFTASEQRVCLVAGESGETSWPAAQLKHGVWASQVIAALQGNAPSALINKQLLTSSSLQTFLATALPRVLQRAYSDKKSQSPACYGPSSGEFLLADLTDLLAERASSGKPQPGDVLGLTLSREHVESIRSLAGFKKTHQVPTVINSYAKSLVAELGAGPIEADVNEVRDALRKHFAFKRKDLDAVSPGDGTGSILTPYFVYSVTVTLNPANPAEIIWRRQISDIKEPEQVLSPAFASVFPKTFSTVEFTPPQPIDLTAFIDQLEDSADDRCKLNYDPAATWCRLSLQGLLGQIEVTPTRFALLQLSPTSPQTLLEAFFKIQAMLVDQYDVRAIGFRA